MILGGPGGYHIANHCHYASDDDLNRNIIARRGKGISLTKYCVKTGEWQTLERGDADDSRLAAIDDVGALKNQEKEVGVVASTQIRMRALGLDTATLRSITIVNPLYVQVLEVVGRHRGRGASIDDVLDGVNALNRSNKRDAYINAVSAKPMNGRGPIRSIGDATARDSGGMVSSQLYPVYDRLTKAGLVFKSIMQKPSIAVLKGKQDVNPLESMSRFIMLYLSRFQDKIELEKGSRLEPTAREVFLQMVVEYLLEVTGGNTEGAFVPFQSIKQELSLEKPEASRLMNFLKKEVRMPNSAIKLHMMDLHTTNYKTKRGAPRPEMCVSLKHSAELEPLALQRPVGLGLYRCVVGIVKSSGEQGANLELMKRKLYFSKKSAGKIVEQLVERPSTYGIRKGYTREGRAAKVQSLFYDKHLIGRGNTLAGAPSIVEANEPVPSTPEVFAATKAGDGVGGGSTEPMDLGGEAPSGAAAGAHAGDVTAMNIDDDMDAFVDTVMEEMDDVFRRTVEAQAKFEMDRVYPPPEMPEAARMRWKLMLPVEKRKEFILEELKKCTATTVVKMVYLLRLMEGPGPVMYRRTMEKIILTMLSEGTIKRATAPLPIEWEGKPGVKMFGTGEMLLQADAPTDLASMIDHANRFRDLELAVSKEMARVKQKSLIDKKNRMEVNTSSNRLLVYMRKIHRTMILHRELLRSLPKLGTQKEESRILDLDRVLLDIPLIMFMTMFGYPPEYLHARELHCVLKKAENEKASVRGAPRAIWELMRHNGWFKEAIKSSLQILHDMSVLVKIDASALASYNDRATAGEAGPLVEPMAYSHASLNPGVIEGFEASGSGEDSAIKIYDEVAKAVAGKKANKGDPTARFTKHVSGSERGMRRDKKARSAAAQALLQAKYPPAEMKLGLGWACLRMDLTVFLADKTIAKRVTDDVQWCEFWTCYQTHGPGMKETMAGRDEGLDIELKTSKGAGETNPVTPLSPSLLAKVPQLADPEEWGVDDSNATVGVYTSWHKSPKAWTQEEDVELLKIVSKAYRDPRKDMSRRNSPGRPRTSRVHKESLQQFAKYNNRSLEACWKRYQKLGERVGGNCPSLPLPVIERKRTRKETNADDLEPNERARRNKIKRGRQSGLLARDGMLHLSELNPSRLSLTALTKARNKAKEEAAIAKAAGFEWVNEEGSWDENHPGGGILPRPFKSWDWTMEELAAFTAVRQLLLMPETRFSPYKALERVKDLRPPSIQKAYRVLLSLNQVDFTEETWQANTMSIEDCIDHEVYKMMGRHGSTVTRGVVAKGKLRDVSFAPKWSSPLEPGGESSSGNDLGVQLKQLYSDTPASHGLRYVPSLAGLASMPVKDVGVDREMFLAVLEGIARGRACFTVSAASDDICDVKDSATGVSTVSESTNQAGGSGTCKPTVSGVHAAVDRASSGGRNQGVEGKGSMGGEPSTGVDQSAVDKYSTVAKFRYLRTIDADIMATALAEVKPVAAVGGGSEFKSSRSGARLSREELRHACEVRGPETEWGSTPDDCGGDEPDSGLAVLTKALEGGKASGLTLPQLRNAVQTLLGGNKSVGSDDVDLAALGCALRTGIAVCFCGAEDVMYVHKNNANACIIPKVSKNESQSTEPSDQNTSGHSRPTPMKVVGQSVKDHREDRYEMENAPTAKGWKGKGKMRTGEGRSRSKAPSAWDGVKAKVWFPWTTVDGEVDLPLLNRFRQDLVAYIRKHPGITVSEIRNAVFPFLSIGELILLLKDLVRRKVLLEDTVPDMAEVTIAGGWGLACQNGEWKIESARAGDTLGGGPSTTSFLPVPGGLETLRKMLRAEHMWVTS